MNLREGFFLVQPAELTECLTIPLNSGDAGDSPVSQFQREAMDVQFVRPVELSCARILTGSNDDAFGGLSAVDFP